MLVTNLKHIESGDDHKRVVKENENVMIICGRMDAECRHVYGIAEELESEYKNVRFYDMEFDNPESQVIRSIPEVQRFEGIPITVYYKNGNVVRATSSVQNRDQIKSILDKEFSTTVKEERYNWWW